MLGFFCYYGNIKLKKMLGSETSHYQQEKKSNEILKVMVSEIKIKKNEKNFILKFLKKLLKIVAI